MIQLLDENDKAQIEQKIKTVSDETNSLKGDKVDKVDGKGLSTNDYDNSAKSKVDAIPENPKYTDTVYDDTQIKEDVAALKGDLSQLSEEMANAGSGMTATVKNAFLECFANVAWATAEGQACYDKLKTALNESVGEIKLSSITATCSETAQIGTAASDLDIVVTAVYSDGSSAQVTGWTTSGTVVEGTNTFVVSYGGKNATVTVTGINIVTVTLENYTGTVTQYKSTTYTDDGNTPVASSGQWYINTSSGTFIQSIPLDEDVTVNISCIPDINCYNGAWVGQVDDGYGLVPSGGNAKQANVYYYKSVALQMLVDTEYSLSNYTIKSGYRLIWNSGGSNTVTPTVEVVS